MTNPFSPWMIVGAPAWARFGRFGWSAAKIVDLCYRTGTVRVFFTERDKPTNGKRDPGLLRPRNPSLKGADKPTSAEASQ